MKDYNLVLLEIYNKNKNYSIEKLKQELNKTTKKGFELKIFENVINKIITYKENQQEKIDKIKYVFIDNEFE